MTRAMSMANFELGSRTPWSGWFMVRTISDIAADYSQQSPQKFHEVSDEVVFEFFKLRDNLSYNHQ